VILHCTNCNDTANYKKRERQRWGERDRERERGRGRCREKLLVSYMSLYLSLNIKILKSISITFYLYTLHTPPYPPLFRPTPLTSACRVLQQRGRNRASSVGAERKQPTLSRIFYQEFSEGSNEDVKVF
jgi:hypothetical protein